MTESSRDMLRHTVATLAYRGAKAVRGAPAGFGDFHASPTSRTPSQILAHLCDLIDWALSQARGQQAWTDSTPASWQEDTERFFRALRAFDEYLASGEPLAYEPGQIFQGAIADALTHVGQINFLRRMFGHPVRGENYFRADITTGRVESDQPAPRREFDLGARIGPGINGRSGTQVRFTIHDSPPRDSASINDSRIRRRRPHDGRLWPRAV